MKPISVFTLLGLVLLSLYSCSPVLAKAQKISRDTTVSISVGGEAHYTIFGYTSPHADVSMHGIGISDQTTSRDDGYFEFANQFSPFKAHEACITARDEFGRLTPEVCLAPFPVKYNVSIGPVLMPPTISLDKPLYYISDEVLLTGQTIPNTEVNISSFTKPKKPLEYLASLNLIKSVEAYAIPQVNSKADSKGNFSFALPSSSSVSYRLFSQTTYESALSPKSLTLSLTIYPLWYIVIIVMKLVWQFITNHIVELTILTNCLILLIYITRMILRPFFVIHHRALMIRPTFELSLRKTYELMTEEDDRDSIEPYRKKPKDIEPLK